MYLFLMCAPFSFIASSPWINSIVLCWHSYPRNNIQHKISNSCQYPAALMCATLLISEKCIFNYCLCM